MSGQSEPKALDAKDLRSEIDRLTEQKKVLVQDIQALESKKQTLKAKSP
jgi:flagellar biosynthesis/type III secretory pathway chaperone